MNNWQNMTADERVFTAQLISIHAAGLQAQSRQYEQLRKVG